MKNLRPIPALLAAVALLSACGPAETPRPAEETATQSADDRDVAPVAGAAEVEIAPGLTMRRLRAGSGPAAAPGDTAIVHYTGWLYDQTAPENRGTKFDSSVDRGQHFSFPLGARRVIRGWDQGVAGMQVGELRELTIAPELAYGDRGAGGLIPPGATLVFEVELAGIESPPGSKEGQ